MEKLYYSCIGCDFCVCPKCHYDQPEKDVEKFHLCKKCDPVNGMREFNLRKKHSSRND